ncbi:hypothetical protein ZWY2020_042318 [Hordeum vulgare]|nr:hypothetical protein ZWY2020_042318 [Hordeum vulgare]
MPMTLLPARLHARSKTTAAQHVAARHLDHIRKLVASSLPLVAASPLLDALGRRRAARAPGPRPPPSPPPPPRPAPLPPPLPRIFDLRPPLPLSLSLTAPAASLLAVASSPDAAAQRSTASSPCPHPAPSLFAPCSASGASSLCRRL